LFEAKLIENKQSIDKLLFGLTEKGRMIAVFLKQIEAKLIQP